MTVALCFDWYLVLIYLFNIRAYKAKILEFLREQWAIDRRAEWSIWMVYMKVEMPHQYISSAVDDSSVHSLHGRSPILRRLTEEVVSLKDLIFDR